MYYKICDKSKGGRFFERALQILQNLRKIARLTAGLRISQNLRKLRTIARSTLLQSGFVDFTKFVKIAYFTKLGKLVKNRKVDDFSSRFARFFKNCEKSQVPRFSVFPCDFSSLFFASLMIYI